LNTPLTTSIQQKTLRPKENISYTSAERKTDKMTKTKTLNKTATLRNINGLSLNDRAYCGPYGTITCYAAANKAAKSPRLFSVNGATKLNNSDGWTMSLLRKHIAG
jgi:hypothetical protein